MRQAHALGMKSTATMMFGSVDTPAERVEHLRRIRELQDETGGFTAFIPWTFAAANTALHEGHRAATGDDYLRLLAVSRVYLDNVANVQASWVTQGLRMGQVALAFGANDMGSTMIEENVVRAAGISHAVTVEELVRLIAAAGFTPVQRDTLYAEVRRYPRP
jgi:cyclic dehypoxanthinyl futalosine synthase